MHTTQLLAPQHLAALRSLRLIARALATGVHNGLHRSRRQGMGIEFGQYRNYVAGDEPRWIDWKLLARSDKYFVRESEVEARVVWRLWLDATGSMQYAEDNVAKIQYARYLLAALAWLARQQSDDVGIIVAQAGSWQALPPRQDRQQLDRMLALLTHAEPNGQWPTAPAPYVPSGLREIHLFVSDLHEHHAEISQQLQHLRHPKHELVLLHLLGRQEIDFSYEGNFLAEDLETRQTLEMDADLARAEYLAQFGSHLQAIQAQCQQDGVTYQRLVLDEALDQHLVQLLRYKLSTYATRSRR